jgi:hypothetical protein
MSLADSILVVAALSLLWFIAINVGDLPHMKKGSRATKNTLVNHLLRGFQESTSDFLDASLVFSSAMQVAAITRYASLFYDPKADFSVYGLVGSIFMSTFTIFPCIILQTVTDRVRRHWLRIFLWLVVIGSSITLKVLFDNVNRNFAEILDRDVLDSEQIKETIWILLCEDERKRGSLQTVGTVMHIWLALNLAWWLWYVGVSVVPQQWKEERKNSRWYHPFQKAQRALLFLDGSISVVIMYACIGHFHWYNDYVRGIAGVDDDDSPASSDDGDWTFGQVLALATWVPVIVQLLSITFCKSTVSRPSGNS